MRMLHDDAIPAREGGAWELRRDQRIRVIDVDGGAICDFVCFNLHKLEERFSQARTKANQGKILLSVGDHLYTRDNNVLLTIAEDTYGIHDMEYGMCSAWVYKNMGGAYDSLDEGFRIGGPLGYPSFGCYEVLQKALSAYPIAPENIPETLNIFQTLAFQMPEGTFRTQEGRSKPGDYIDFVARMDTLCAVSACPAAGRPLRVQVYEP